ncbi:UNVERIFIED_CONTAM: hypothetical protein O8I53_05315 [Campylobacter lari]
MIVYTTFGIINQNSFAGVNFVNQFTSPDASISNVVYQLEKLSKGLSIAFGVSFIYALIRYK